MKKGLKLVSWIPFGISIGALILYFRYLIMFKMDSNIIVTDVIRATLNQYLIVTFVSLFIGLLFILFDKLKDLKETQKIIKEDVKIENENIDASSIDEDFINAIENNSRVLNTNSNSNFMKYVKSNKVIRVKLSNSINNTTLKGKIVDTDEDIEILLLDEDIEDLNFKKNVMSPIKCTKCGNILNEDAFICTNCGVILNKEILNSIIIDYNNKLKREDKTEKIIMPKKRNFSIIRFLANLLVIILCLFLIFLIGNKIINEREINFNKMNITDVETN